MKIIEGNLSIDKNKKIAIISSRFNHLITDRLIEGAKDAFLRQGGLEENLSLILAPGAFELPFVLKQAISSKNFHAFCVLGAIIRGSTPHFDFVAAECSKGIANTALNTELPTSFGVLTVDSIEQALERAGTKAGNKGFEAMSTVIELLNLQEKLKAL